MQHFCLQTLVILSKNQSKIFSCTSIGLLDMNFYARELQHGDLNISKRHFWQAANVLELHEGLVHRRFFQKACAKRLLRQDAETMRVNAELANVPCI